MSAPAVIHTEEDWEFVDDDGFIYKRRKRDPSSSSSYTAQVAKSRDLRGSSRGSASIVQAEQLQRQKKKELLLTLKARYTKELEEWKSLFLKQKHSSGELHRPEEVPDSSVGNAPSIEVGYDTYQKTTENLLFQVEQHEEHIQALTELCIDAEAMCKRMYKDLDFEKLLTWKSPRSLVHGITSPDKLGL